MSFLDLESQRNSKRFGPTRNGVSTTETLLAQLAQNVRLLQKECAKVGTSRDSRIIRAKIETELIPNCSSFRDQITNSGISADTKQYHDFKNLVTLFASLQEQYMFAKTKHTLPREKTTLSLEDSHTSVLSNDTSSSANETAPLMSNASSQRYSSINRQHYGNEYQQDSHQPYLQQKHVQIQQDDITNQEELDFQALIQRERHEQISKIHGAVSEVNAIFHQLGTLVKEQGEQVETIGENVHQFSENVQRANTELVRAEQNQRKRNRCGLLTLIIFSLFCLILVLSILG